MSDRAKVEITWMEKDNRPELEPGSLRRSGRHRPAPRAAHRRDRGKVAAKDNADPIVFTNLESEMNVVFVRRVEL